MLKFAAITLTLVSVVLVFVFLMLAYEYSFGAGHGLHPGLAGGAVGVVVVCWGNFMTAWGAMGMEL